MKTIKTLIISLSALLLFTVGKAQTADEIIAKHIDALGGADKLSQVNSVYLEVPHQLWELMVQQKLLL